MLRQQITAEVVERMIGFGERTCHCCGKTFLITCPLRDYTYKIQVNHQATKWFCCYTHYKQGKEEREDEKTRNRQAYIQRRFHKKEGRR